MPRRLAISLDEARRLTAALRERGEAADPTDVRTWPIRKVREAWFWIDLYDARKLQSNLDWPPDHRGLIVSFEKFVKNRAAMPSCRLCGCTRDNACLDLKTC